ncbi:MAG: hypothetical protein OEZ36_03995, partial [Spirochaetota bacterium]|nr:hypothetical protein [Spirochaetota bacterium]
ILTQCGDDRNLNVRFPEKEIKPYTKLYRVREILTGSDFRLFSYMYTLSESDANRLGDYYKVYYNRFGREVKSEEFIRKEKRSVTRLKYRSDHLLDQVERMEGAVRIFVMKYLYEKQQLNRVVTYIGDKKLFESGFFYNKNGELDKVIELKLAKPLKTYYFKNSRQTSQTYAPNRKDEYFYTQDGLLKEEKHYSNNELKGSVRYFYNSNGDRIRVEFYDKDNQPNGRWMFLDDIGFVTSVKSYIAGKPQSSKKIIYNNTGLIIREDEFVNDKLIHYYQYQYHQDGRRKRWDKYNPEKKAIEWEIYSYPAGKPMIKEYFVNDISVIKWEFKDGKWLELKEDTK